MTGSDAGAGAATSSTAPLSAEMPETGDTPTDRLANRYFRALEVGDGDTVRSCYAPDMGILHNAFGILVSAEKHVEALERWFFVEYRDRRFVDVRQHVFPGGFVRQHTLTATVAKTGAPISMPICLVCLVCDGLIIRIDEYLPEAQVASDDPILDFLR